MRALAGRRYALPKREAYRLFVYDLTPDFSPAGRVAESGFNGREHEDMLRGDERKIPSHKTIGGISSTGVRHISTQPSTQGAIFNEPLSCRGTERVTLPPSHGLASPLGQADDAERAVYETVLRAKRAEVDFLQGRAEATSMVRPLLVNDATHAPTPTLTDSDRH